MTLEEVRLQIDTIDKEMKELFIKRMALAENVARVKAQTADAIFKPDREKVIIAKQSADMDEDIQKEYIAFIKRVMEVSRKYQYGKTLELRDCFDIAYVTEEKQFKKLVGRASEAEYGSQISDESIIKVDTLEEIKEYIDMQKVDAGVIVLEEEEGKESEAVLNWLVQEKLYINHCELQNDTSVRVADSSRPQDTKEHQKTSKVAVVSNHLMVQPTHEYMKVTFICQDKLSDVGKILTMIADYGVDITQLYSNIENTEHRSYRFYLELNANFLDQKVKALLFQLENESQAFQVLGSYDILRK